MRRIHRPTAAVTPKPTARRVAMIAAVVSLVGAPLTVLPSVAATASPVADHLATYNERWTSKSANVTGSMPIGDGTRAANVWVEGNTLKVLLAAGDAWDENVRQAKLGTLNITFSPNPYASGSFVQELKLREGEIVITSGTSPTITTRVWFGANEQTMHVESSAASNFSTTVDFVNARPSLVTNPSTSNFTFYDLINSEDGVVGVQPTIYPDVVYSRSNKLEWAHHNSSSTYDEINTMQKLSTSAFADPLTGRTFGGVASGAGFTVSSPTRLQSTPSTSNRLDVTLHSQIDRTSDWLTRWENAITSLASTSASTPIESLRSAHQTWWGDFWERSYIFATGDADADTVTRGWLNTRYVQAIAGRTANTPIRFNGSLFTPGSATDPDFRLWNSFHQFNQRFTYWSMLQSGDFDLMKPYFDQYRSSLDLAKARVAAFWGAPQVAEPTTVQTAATQGAMWPEVMGLWGQSVGGEYGWNRAGHNDAWFSGSWTRFLYGGNLEVVAMMLDYFSYTGDTAFANDTLLPVAREVIKFYDTHWVLQNGKIDMFPMYSGEGDRLLHNPMVDTAGLHNALEELLALPAAIGTSADRTYWSAVQTRLPNLPIGASASDNDSNYGAADRLKTSSDVFLGSDTNNQNLWPIFPFRMFGYGQPNLELAIASYNDRRGKYPVDGSNDWRHDAIHAAYLGLADEARFQTVAAFRAGAWRYRGFGPGGGDGEPGQEPTAIAKTALEAMLLHPGANGQSTVFTAWPANWNVQFKLRTAGAITVTGSRVGDSSEYTVTSGDASKVVGRSLPCLNTPATSQNPSPGATPVACDPNSGPQPPTAATYQWAAQPGSSVAAADVDGDGKADLIVRQSNGELYIRYGQGNGQFGSQTQSEIGIAGSLFAGDLAGDGKADLVRRDGSAWALNTGTGSGTFGADVSWTWNSNPTASYLVGDFDADSNSDLVAWEPNGNLYIKYGTGGGDFTNQSLSTGWVSTSAYRVAADFNGDQKADIAVWDSAASRWVIRHGTGAGAFGSEATAVTSAPSSSVTPLAADVDGNGLADLILWNQSAGVWSTYLNVESAPPVTGNRTVKTGSLTLDVPGNSTTGGTQLALWSPNGGANQSFTFTPQAGGAYEIKALGSGLCLDVSGNSTAAGAAIIQWSCSGASNQRWTLTRLMNGTYTIASVSSGLYLTAASASAGATITQQGTPSTALAQWVIE